MIVDTELSPWMSGFLLQEQEWPIFLGNPIEIDFPNPNVLQTNLDIELWLPPDYSRRHNLVVGTSGGGKTRLLSGQCIDRFERGHGVTVIDSQKSLINYLLAYFAKRYEETGDESILERVHLIDVGPEWCPNYQPLQHRDEDYEDIPEEFREVAALMRQEASVDRFIRSLLRTNTQAEKEMMRRLSKGLRQTNAPLAVPRENGQQLSPADIDIIRDVYHPMHNAVYAKLQHRLPEHVRLGIEWLHFLKSKNRFQDIERRMESTENAIAESFTTPYRMLFSRPDLPSLDIRGIIQRGDILLVDTSETPFRSAETGSKIGGLIQDEVYNASADLYHAGTPVEHDLVADEIGDNVTEGLGRQAETARKLLLSYTYAPQSLSTVRNGQKVDLAPELINNCKTIICFQAKDPETVEILGKHFAIANRDLTERLQLMDRPDRDEIVTLVNNSQGGTRSVARTRFQGRNTMESNGVVLTNAKGNGGGRGGSHTHARQKVDTSMFNQGSGNSRQTANNQGATSGFHPLIMGGQIIQIPGTSQSSGMVNGNGSNNFESSGNATSDGTSDADSRSWNRFWSEMESLGFSRNRGTGESQIWGISNILSQSWTTTFQQQLVQRTREEWMPTGEPRFSLPYQDAVYMYMLATMPDRYAFMRTRVEGVERTILFRVREVPDVFDDPQEERRVVESFTEALYKQHAYMFRPEMPDVTQRRRIDAFLSDGSTQDRSDDEHSPSDEAESDDDFR